eukprot:6485570-Pyramimonas_sp.AAC.1
MAPGAAQNGQRAPEAPQQGFQRGPGWPKGASKEAQKVAQTAQHGPMWPHQAPKIAQEGLQGCPARREGTGWGGGQGARCTGPRGDVQRAPLS